MKTKYLKYINTFAIAIPLIIAMTYPFFKEAALLSALLSIAVTGFIQLSLAVIMILNNSQDMSLYLYFAGVALFFILWLRNHIVGYDNFLTFTLVPAPFLLSFYLSFLIYIKR
ncbi:hypothetical protein [Flavobacterium reichenbachii]|uniref:Uncharacterized protein n=1 Tax=Flavobacterium reichenbachii TaxID=362418 RepID=A0A085ZLK5_9FLAO|nr:hypothetical protein [Flavobacterium reichenbachii]KFF05319.1 hypothetical protein IW19_07140 [Flavobacterium reichenbachii]OXB16014.1 hypothetical protein B0A68_07020 [Flavobacterium reichenbachii]